MCLFSRTLKALLVVLFKASGHGHVEGDLGCCWGSAHRDPVGRAF